MFRALSFRMKMICGCLTLVLLTLVCMGGINYTGLRGTFTDLGKGILTTVSDEAIQTLAMQNGITQEKVSSDLVSMDKELERYGSMFLDESSQVTMTITNQVTKKSENATFPALKVGDQIITNDFTIVDNVQATVGGTATIFQVLPGKLLRVSTNVRKLDGARATGTYIPDSSPVYKTVMKGETFRGKAYVVNDWFITAYKPVRDSNGNVVAVIYVGRKIMTPQLKKFISSVNVAGKGFASIFNDKGSILVHPDSTIVGKDIETLPYGAMVSAAKDGIISYEDQGKKSYAAMKAFKPWGWHLMVTLSEKEMLQEANAEQILFGLISAGVALGLSVLLVLLFTAILLKPIKAASVVAQQASEGDLDARMVVTSNDEIGRLFSTFNGLMERIGRSMRENQGYVNMLNAVSDPIYALDDDQNITLANEATAKICGKQRTELVGKKCSTAFGVESETFATARKSDNESGQTIGIPTASGGMQFYRIVHEALLDDTGKRIGSVETAKDITDMRIKEQELEKNLDHIHEVNSRIKEAGIQLADNIDSAASQISEVQRGTDVQRERTAETATAMEEMNATVLEVARNASQAADNAEEARKEAGQGVTEVNEAGDAIRSVQEQMLTLKDRMSSLGDQAQGIGQIMTMITDIADQTNLLALNAAIEAARAGDAGRGFAVVADEVRKLAEKTMSATQDVESAVNMIQSGTSEAIQATDKTAKDITETADNAQRSGQRLEQIQALVVSTSEQVQSIATAAEQQSAASEEINRSVDEINLIAGETAHGMQNTAEAMEKISELAVQLEKLAEG